MDELLKHDHEIINDAWQFLKKYAGATWPDWPNAMDDEFIGLYRKYNGPENDFAHRILDTVLGEVLALHEDGGTDK